MLAATALVQQPPYPARPMPRLPGLPTMMESGVLMEVIGRYAIFAPAHTAKPVLARLHADLNKVLNNADVRNPLDDQGVDARSSTRAALTAFVRAETQRWQHAVKASGATVQ